MNNFVRKYMLVDHTILQCTNCKGMTSVIDNKYNYPCKCGGLMILVPFHNIANRFGFRTFNDFYNIDVYHFMLCNKCKNYELSSNYCGLNVRPIIDSKCGYKGCDGRIMLIN